MDKCQDKLKPTQNLVDIYLLLFFHVCVDREREDKEIEKERKKTDIQLVGVQRFSFADYAEEVRCK